MIIGESKRFNYTGNIQEIILKPGLYKLECWGASGHAGYWANLGGYSHPGNGGYICGELLINALVNLYIQVGSNTGYNGGGYGYNGPNGGGATDIRLISGAWDNLDSLKSRIIVAGGGGGDEWGYSNGGAGGNLIGGTGTPGYTNNGQRYCYGGSQHSGGSGYINGSFGCGGCSNNDDVGGCGGGGYYGGGSNYYSGGGGGGSSYAAGHPECDTTYNKSHQKNITLQNVNYKQGINNGNGYAIITALDIFNSHKNSNFYKDSYYQEYFDFNKLIEGD